MHFLEISLLGPPKISLDGKPVGTDRHKAIGLLAYLAAESKAHNREVLASLLWPDYPRASAFSYLRRTVWELNQVLGKAWIAADRESVSLARNPGLSVDIEAFQLSLAAAPDQVDLLSKAVRLYRGDFLEGFVIADTAPFEEWQIQQAEYYRQEFGHLLERLVSVYERRGDYEDGLPFAQRWLGLDRLNETAYRAVMRLMAGMGDRSGAIHVYQTCTQTLKNELGVAPQAETEELYQAILHREKLKPPPSEARNLPAKEPQKPAGNLPKPTTPFIGRHEEIDQVVKLTLDPDIHLLTLTGPGGTGKTRLSIQAAAEMDKFFQDGAWFIPLAPVQTKPELILAIAKGLYFSISNERENPHQQLLDFLRAKRILLVLDNFEQLLGDGTQLIADILDTAQDVKLLVTSRERLNLTAEQVYRVGGLRIPGVALMAAWEDPVEQAKPFSALQLLLERGQRVRPDFELTRENLTAVMQICQLVEGSPLGIELATAWLELLPPEEIAREITHSLDFLENNAVDVPDRQRSMRAVFETSWILLDVEGQRAFKRLCVFKGSFSRQAAQEISGASLQTLLSLVNKSWLQQGESGRYLVHELLRQYGSERLQADPNEWRETRGRHAEYFSRFLQEQGQALRTDRQTQALQAIKIELESNLSLAWVWMLSVGRFDVLIERMLPGLFHYWLIRSSQDNFIPILKQARKAASVFSDREHLVQVAILETVETNFEIGWFSFEDQPKERLEQLWERVNQYNLEEEMGFWYLVLIATYGSVLNFKEGFQRLQDILPIMNNLQDPWNFGYYYLLLSQNMVTELPDIRRKYLSDALRKFQDIGVVHEQGITLRTLGRLAASEMDYETAIEYSQAAQRCFEQVGDSLGVDSIWNNLAEYYIFLGKIDQAFHAFEELRCFNEKTGNRRMLGTDLSWESMAASRYARLDYALETRLKSLEIAQEVGNLNDIAWHTWEMGEIYRLMGDLGSASKYYHEAVLLFEKINDVNGLGFYHRGCAEIAILQGNWLEARRQYEQALVFLEKDQTGKIWGLTFFHARLGVTLIQLGSFSEAKQHLKTSISLAEILAHPDLKAVPLTGIASLLAATGIPEQAIEIAACVAYQSTTWNEVKKQAGIILEAAMQTLPADDARFWKEHGEGMEIDKLSRHYRDNF
jgi:DNA-binding SARP family transcriptional activator/predicted ATPase